MLFTLLTMLCFAETRSCTTIMVHKDLTAEECQLTLDIGVSSIILEDGTEYDTRGMGFVCALQPPKE